MNIEQAPTLIQYSRKKNGQLNGCMVATVVDNKVKIGYSKCNKIDRFSKAFARQLAVDRMNSNRVSFENIPESMTKDAAKFIMRIKTYYKDLVVGFKPTNKSTDKIAAYLKELYDFKETLINT